MSGFANKPFKTEKDQKKYNKKDHSPVYTQATTFQDDNFGSKLLWYKDRRLCTTLKYNIIKSMKTGSLSTMYSDKRLTGHSARKESIQKQKDADVQDT